MTKKKLLRLLTISYISLAVSAGSAFAMDDAMDSSSRDETRSPVRAQKNARSPSLSKLDVAYNTEGNTSTLHVDAGHALPQISAAALDHSDHDEDLQVVTSPSYNADDLAEKFEFKWLSAFESQRIFGIFVTEFDTLSKTLFKPKEEIASSSAETVNKPTHFRDESVAVQMKDLRDNLINTLRPLFGFTKDADRFYATNDWRVSSSYLIEQAATLRLQAGHLDEVAKLMRHQLNKPKEAEQQEALRDLMTKTARSLDTLFSEIQASPEFESFSLWKYFKPTNASRVVLVVTPLTFALYEQALDVLELMERKLGDLSSEDSFDLTNYRPMKLTAGPTLEEMKSILFPPIASS